MHPHTELYPDDGGRSKEQGRSQIFGTELTQHAIRNELEIIDAGKINGDGANENAFIQLLGQKIDHQWRTTSVSYKTGVTRHPGPQPAGGAVGKRDIELDPPAQPIAQREHQCDGADQNFEKRLA